MRVWLKIRMPDFRLKDKEVKALTRYFIRFRRGLTSKTVPLPDGSSQPAGPSSIDKGKELYALYECAKCHPTVGATIEPGQETAVLAPSLEDAGRRLKPDWILSFLRDPQSIYPDTKMPNFFYDSGEPMEDEAEAKIAAIRDYLMSLKN
jgi:mono/diheme cytochrome c family protein